MTRTVEAVYSGGVFRPVAPLDGIKENDRLVLTFTPTSGPTQAHPLASWVGGLSDEDAADMMRVIDEEFGQVDPNDWK